MTLEDVLSIISDELRESPGIESYHIRPLAHLHVINGKRWHFIVSFDGRKWNVLRWSDDKSFHGGDYPESRGSLQTSEGELNPKVVSNAIYAYVGF